jgi:hypothetical protein
MVKQDDLDVEFCVSLVISSTPSPSTFKKDDDPTVVTLGDLDLINARFVGFYITGVRSGIRPYRLDISESLDDETSILETSHLVDQHPERVPHSAGVCIHYRSCSRWSAKLWKVSAGRADAHQTDDSRMSRSFFRTC